MKNQSQPPPKSDEEQTRFYLIFKELANLELVSPASDASFDEIEEMERVSRMVADVSEEPHRFITST